MSLLERWREAKAKRKAINNTIDRSLTAEHKLVFARNKMDRNINWFFAILALFIASLVGLTAMDALGEIDGVLGAYFGENVWADIRDSSHSINWSYNIMVGSIATMLVILGFSTFRTMRTERRLENEIVDEIVAEMRAEREIAEKKAQTELKKQKGRRRANADDS